MSVLQIAKALPTLALASGLVWSLAPEPSADDLSGEAARPLSEIGSNSIAPKPELAQVRASFFQKLTAPISASPPPATPVVADDKPHFRVAGIIARRAASVATVELSDNRGLLRVKENENVDGWTVTQIMDRAILVSQKGRSFEIPLDPPAR